MRGNMSSSPPYRTSGPPSSSPFSSSTILTDVTLAQKTAMANIATGLLDPVLTPQDSSSKSKRYIILSLEWCIQFLTLNLRNTQDLDEDDKENEGQDDSFMTYGRQYACGGDIFASIDDVMQFGVMHTVSESDDKHELTSVYVLLIFL